MACVLTIYTAQPVAVFSSLGCSEAPVCFQELDLWEKTV